MSTASLCPDALCPTSLVADPPSASLWNQAPANPPPLLEEVLCSNPTEWYEMNLFHFNDSGLACNRLYLGPHSVRGVLV